MKDYRILKYISRVAMLVMAGLLVSNSHVSGQAVSPFQTGAYMTAFSHVRDMAKSPPGFFVLCYNAKTNEKT